MNNLASSHLTWYRVAFKIGHGLPDSAPRLEFLKAEIKAKSPEIAAMGFISQIFPDWEAFELDLFHAELMENGSYMIPFPKSVSGVWVRPLAEGELS